MSIYAPEIEETVETAERQKLKEPPLFKVLLHNDDYTTMEFVIYVLVEIFRRSEVDAIRIMLQVHEKGVGIAGVFSYEIAETRVTRVMALARECEYPLLCTMEEQ
ncbi:MAG: ATP-dependent Clp protease adaptor ClpS [Blastocatellia bacterium]|jgi:ATP-dependent Clp protease adaptor protein ClpS